MIGIILAWLRSLSWGAIFFWSVAAVSVVCCIAGAWLTWQRMVAEESSE